MGYMEENKSTGGFVMNDTSYYNDLPRLTREQAKNLYDKNKSMIIKEDWRGILVNYRLMKYDSSTNTIYAGLFESITLPKK